jgi:acyl-coenzyme A synthetase/AMP-(fatty) acid ligase
LQAAETSSPDSVAGVLVALARQIWVGGELQLSEPDFTGEGVAAWGPTVGSGLAAGFGADWARAISQSEGRIILHTSGSSGVPKRVQHRIAALGRSVVVSPRHQAAVWALAFNPTHIAGVQVVLQAWANGNPVVNLWGVSPAEAVSRCRQWGVTHVSATPTFYRLLLAEGAELPAVKSLTVGGEPAEEALLERLRQHFPGARIHNVYASTEAGMVLAGEGLDFEIPADKADRVAIRDGRLWIHRSQLGEFGQVDGWYDTGDRVEPVAGSPGRFRIVGRERREINVGGEKVDPAEVERHLLAHPGVVLARVFGRSNSVTGALLAAEVVPRDPQVDEATLRQYLAARLRAPQVPRLIRLVSELELTRTGKVLP